MNKQRHVIKGGFSTKKPDAIKSLIFPGATDTPKTVKKPVVTKTVKKKTTPKPVKKTAKGIIATTKEVVKKITGKKITTKKKKVK